MLQPTRVSECLDTGLHDSLPREIVTQHYASNGRLSILRDISIEPDQVLDGQGAARDVDCPAAKCARIFHVLENIDHDDVRIFDRPDGGNVDVLDRGAIPRVYSYAVDLNGTCRRHQVSKPRFPKHMLNRFASLQLGVQHARASANGQCVAVAVKAARDSHETSRALDKYGRPKHPLHLTEHRCIGYSHTMNNEVWRFRRGGRSASVRPSGPLRVNNGDAMMPALIAGTGLGILPEFFLRKALESKQLERLLPDWSIPLGAVYWVTPPEEPVPKRVEVLRDYLIEKLTRAAVALASECASAPS